MAQTNKTTENDNSVNDFIASTEASKQQDARRLVSIFQDVSGFAPKMWGTAIIGFGSYHYKYDSGREGDAPLVGFSPRKNEFALYIAAYAGREDDLARLGKHKTGKGCMYLKKVSDADESVLREIIAKGIEDTKSRYPG